MAIVGITNRENFNITKAVPRLGKLRKGAPKGDKAPGKDLSYFRVDFEAQYAYMADVFESIYTAQPTEFDVKLVGNTVEEVFPTARESWSATTLLHQCDEEVQSIHYNTQTRRYDNTPIACEKGNDPDKFACGCTRIGRLAITLPELTKVTGVMGTFIIETHSIHDIINVFNQLMFLEQQLGALMWVPVKVGRAEKERSYQRSDGKRANKKFNLLYIAYDVPMLERYMKPTLAPPVDQLQLPEQVDHIVTYDPNTLALSAPDIEDEDEDIEESAVINPEAIAEWFQEALGEGITVTDVLEAFKNNSFKYQEAGENMKLYALAITLEYWHFIPESEQVDLDTIAENANTLFPNSPDAVKYIMGIVTGSITANQ